MLADRACNSIYEHLENLIRFNVPHNTYEHRVWRKGLTTSTSAIDSGLLHHI